MTQDSKLKTQTKLNFKPLGPFVILQKIDKEKETSMGIILPADQDQDHNKGRVLALGPGELQNGQYVPMPGVQQGDIVMYDDLSADPLPDLGEDIYICKQGALMLVFENN